MIKKIFSLVFLVAVFALTCQPVLAKIPQGGPGGKLGIGARFAFVDSRNYSSGTDTINSDVEAETFFQYTGGLTYYIFDFLSIELEGGYGETKMITTPVAGTNGVYVAAGDRDGIGRQYGTLKQYPILFTMRIMIPTGTNWYPYIGGGVGYNINEFEMDQAFADWMNAQETAGTMQNFDDVNVDNSFSFHVNGGFECFLTENSAVNLDFKYTWHEVEFNNGPTVTPRDEDVEMDGYSVGGGIKFFFF